MEKKLLFFLLLSAVSVAGLSLVLRDHHTIVRTLGREGAGKRVFTLATPPLAVPSQAHRVDFEEQFVAPHDFWITGFRWATSGAPVALRHHLHLINQDQYGDPCPYIPKTLFARSGEHPGEAFASTRFPAGYGIPVRRGDRLLLKGELHNPPPPHGPGGDYDDVRIVVDMVTTAKAQKPIEIAFLRFSDSPCTFPHGFTVPPNVEEYTVESSDFTSATASFTFSRRATIIRMGGAFRPWAGGRELIVFVNGEPLHTFRATRPDPEKEYLWAVPLLEGDPFVAQVEAGDTISFQVKYTNPHPYPIIDAMGALRMYYTYDE